MEGMYAAHPELEPITDLPEPSPPETDDAGDRSQSPGAHQEEPAEREVESTEKLKEWKRAPTGRELYADDIDDELQLAVEQVLDEEGLQGEDRKAARLGRRASLLSARWKLVDEQSQARYQTRADERRNRLDGLVRADLVEQARKLVLRASGMTACFALFYVASYCAEVDGTALLPGVDQWTSTSMHQDVLKNIVAYGNDTLGAVFERRAVKKIVKRKRRRTDGAEKAGASDCDGARELYASETGVPEQYGGVEGGDSRSDTAGSTTPAAVVCDLDTSNLNADSRLYDLNLSVNGSNLTDGFSFGDELNMLAAAGGPMDLPLPQVDPLLMELEASGGFDAMGGFDAVMQGFSMHPTLDGVDMLDPFSGPGCLDMMDIDEDSAQL
ncbi:hypothetical protein AURDEDRAFT_169863, partial [Auricularia subglabra TFB-10046 SS5]